MAEMIVELPEPIYERLSREATAGGLSPSGWLARKLRREFGIAISTEKTAKRRAMKTLRAEAGNLLRAGKPLFDATTLQWRVPVLPNLRDRELKPVGFLCLDAKTGEVLIDSRTVNEMAEKAGPELGIQQLPFNVQNRLDALLDAQTESALTDSEKRELDELVTHWEIHNLTNLLRLTECLRIPPSNQSLLDTASAHAKDTLRTLHKKNEVTSDA